MLVLLWGTPRDSPIAAVNADLDRLQIPHVLLDQRSVLLTEVELSVDRSVAGVVRVNDSLIDLNAVTAVYARPHNVRELPAIEQAGPDSPEGRHAVLVTDLLWAWTEMADALVVNRPSAMASNDSKPYQL